MSDQTINIDSTQIRSGKGFFTRLKRIVWFPFSYVFTGKAVL